MSFSTYSSLGWPSEVILFFLISYLTLHWCSCTVLSTELKTHISFAYKQAVNCTNQMWFPIWRKESNFQEKGLVFCQARVQVSSQKLCFSKRRSLFNEWVGPKNEQMKITPFSFFFFNVGDVMGQILQMSLYLTGISFYSGVSQYLWLSGRLYFCTWSSPCTHPPPLSSPQIFTAVFQPYNSGVLRLCLHGWQQDHLWHLL